MGIPVVVAAGNDSSDACDFSPARNSYVLTVGSSNLQDQLSPFSNTGTCVNILAPGSQITSLAPRNQYQVLDGTSASAPHATGVLSLLLSQDSTLSPMDLYSRIVHIATPNQLTNLRNTANRLLFNQDGENQQ